MKMDQIARATLAVQGCEKHLASIAAVLQSMPDQTIDLPPGPNGEDTIEQLMLDSERFETALENLFLATQSIVEQFHQGKPQPG